MWKAEPDLDAKRDLDAPEVRFVPANTTENRYPLSRLGNERKECKKNEKVPRCSLVI